MGKKASKADGHWADPWLDSVATRRSSMTQRSVTRIEKREGGLRELGRRARQRGVHLLLLEDDQGRKIVAASTKPFRVIC